MTNHSKRRWDAPQEIPSEDTPGENRTWELVNDRQLVFVAGRDGGGWKEVKVTRRRVRVLLSGGTVVDGEKTFHRFDAHDLLERSQPDPRPGMPY